MQNASILVLEDERAIAEMTEIILRKEGFVNITLCSTVYEAMKVIESEIFHFYLLDIMLPDGNGLDVAKVIRAQSDAPIFFLTAKASDADKLRGFMNGADDYITKPFNPLELVARVKAQLARYMKKMNVQKDVLYSCSRFTFNVDAAELTVDGVKDIIGGRLFHLLKYLCENTGQVLSKEQIYERVWGEYIFDDNTVMVHIRKLREKIEEDPSKPTHIITVRGIGYKFVGDNR
ncbi:response regulator transcription factor [Lysinibacillus sp. NPDC096418]|uniref:response regulator transcription factor n=1 Tax=Lysinibacillus sp. NPDC096418 TaxID=3364138 RepID=UPI0037F5CD2A